MLTHITGKIFREEVGTRTTSFDLVRSIRQHRMQWLVHILRAGDDRLLYQAVAVQAEIDNSGNLLMNAPPHNSLQELSLLAADRVGWKRLVRNIM